MTTEELIAIIEFHAWLKEEVVWLLRFNRRTLDTELHYLLLGAVNAHRNFRATPEFPSDTHVGYSLTQGVIEHYQEEI